MVISGYSEFLLERLGPEPALRTPAQEIASAAERASSLTHQLLAFSRKQMLAPRILDLNSVVTENLKMLNRVIGEDIDLVMVPDPGLASVRADSGQIEQVIMNLAVNARDAMPSGGKLTIETSNVVLDEEYARFHAPLRPGEYVMLAISDTGQGMDAETQSHIFEPFFTTKGPKGTGLGLSTFRIDMALQKAGDDDYALAVLFDRSPDYAAGLNGHNPAFAVTDTGENSHANSYKQHGAECYFPLEFQGC